MISAFGWSVVGLIYDIVGAVFLAFAIFLNSPKKVAAQAGTYWDFNPHLLKAISEQTTDARSGLIFLVFGFALQLVGQWRLPESRAWSITLLVLLGIFVLFYVTVLRRHLTSRLEARVRAMYAVSEKAAT
ncbi:hypothetical protein [Pseudolabrys sp.]|uniref:hypothetical protein n=1 Tax=Pseudolabrys sp. TaxID=1960880 RepID=UPI003D0A510F